MVSHLKFWSHNLHSWCDRIVVLGFSVLFFLQFECKVIQSSHNLVNPSLWILSLRISHIWRFWLLEDLESSTKNNSVKISSQFLKFSVFRAQFSGSHYGNSQFRSEIFVLFLLKHQLLILIIPMGKLVSWHQLVVIKLCVKFLIKSAHKEKSEKCSGEYFFFFYKLHKVINVVKCGQ